jgi:dTDP-4-dehydrorhamnose reductase
MVGRAVTEYCRSNADLVFAYDHSGLDIGDLNRVTETVKTDKPDVIINCAAWTDVDGCERDKERAFAANAYGPENLATAGHALDASLVTISTDYVFDGTKPGFYTQNDQPNPQSVYGKSKLEGGAVLLPRSRPSSCAPVLSLVRVKQFLSTIVQRAIRGEQIKAISDAFGTPTYALDSHPGFENWRLAIFGDIPRANEGDGVSYEEFAREALRLAVALISTSKEYSWIHSNVRLQDPRILVCAVCTLKVRSRSAS